MKISNLNEKVETFKFVFPKKLAELYILIKTNPKIDPSNLLEQAVANDEVL